MREKPALISYVATFLKPEMLHVYRQVSGITAFENWVVTRKAVNRDQFPYSKLIPLHKSPLRLFRRLYYRSRGLPVPLSGHECRQLHRIADEKEAGVIHLYLGTEAARALPYLQKETRAKVVSFHGTDLSESLSKRDFSGLLRHTDLFLVRSRSLEAALLQRGCPPDRIRLNRTSIPIPTIDAPRTLPSDRPLRLLQACRFIPKKGLDVTLQACALLQKQGLKFELHLAGDGPELPILEQLVRDLGMSDNVKFLGFVKNDKLLKRLPDYDLFLHPSRTTADGDREGIPNSLLEAMSFAIPVVATRHSGIPEAVSDGVNGRLIETAEPQLLADAVAELISGTEGYARYSEAAYRTVADNFSSEVSIRALEQSYNHAIELANARIAH